MERKLINLAGFKKNGMKGIGIWASVALAMMFVGAICKSVVSPNNFGIVERFSVFAAVGFNAVLGVYLLNGFGNSDKQIDIGDSNYKNL